MTALFACALLLARAQEPVVDLSRYDAAGAARVEKKDGALRVSWPAGEGRTAAATFALAPGKPLLAALEVGGSVLARDVTPRFTVTTGSRTERAAERYIFFDKPAKRPTERHEAKLAPASARVESEGDRLSIAFSALSAGPFQGELVFRVYAGSPLLHAEAALAPAGEKILAYIYDFVLEGAFPTLAWKDTADRLVRARDLGEPAPLAVRHRTVMAESPEGTIAVFPPPHAFFFPRDHTDNFKFVQAGKGVFGLRQDPSQKNDFVPWFDAPPGKLQRMGAFVLLSPRPAEETLGFVKRYTHGDAFKPLDGRLTFASHWHLRLTVNELAGKSRAAEAVQVFKDMGVDLVHLAEFHGDPGGHKPNDPGTKRLPELKAMFELCRKYSDEKLLLIPGEEANMQLNTPAPKGTHPGHWVYLFPKPVYFTGVRAADAPFEEELAPYGKVYRAGSEQEMAEILKREKGLAWTAHPRIKASFACPDIYKEKDWYKSDTWLGGAWKAMPGDLSDLRLGVRVLDLLDDMNTWGQRKCAHGEVDTFELDRTHELYGHMNVNYLRLAKRPTSDDWSPVLDVLRRGDFFVSTGEVLIHSLDVKEGKVKADLEWTFPLAQVLVAAWDGRALRRTVHRLKDTPEFGRRAFEWPLELPEARWVRLEAWDVAGDGAFTQPLWLR